MLFIKYNVSYYNIGGRRPVAQPAMPLGAEGEARHGTARHARFACCGPRRTTRRHTAPHMKEQQCPSPCRCVSGCRLRECTGCTPHSCASPCCLLFTTYRPLPFRGRDVPVLIWRATHKRGDTCPGKRMRGQEAGVGLDRSVGRANPDSAVSLGLLTDRLLSTLLESCT